MARRNTNAFTLVEMLLALGLTAALMAAVGAAIHGSLSSYRENEQMARATQAARSVMDRITRDIRAAEAVSVTSFEVTIIPIDDGSGTDEIRYEYDYQTRILTYYRTVDGVTSSYPMLGAGDVELTMFYAMSELGKDWQKVPCTKNVTLRVEFAVGGEITRVTASAAPRRNQLY